MMVQVYVADAIRLLKVMIVSLLSASKICITNLVSSNKTGDSSPSHTRASTVTIAGDIAQFAQI